MGLAVYALQVSAYFDEREWLPYLRLLPIEKQRAIARFIHQADRQRALLAALFARHLIAERLLIPFGDVEFRVSAYGKPELVDDLGIRFNITHSGRWVGVTIDCHPVGIDIEQVYPIDIGLAERFFSELEVDDLMQLSGEAQREHFFQLWTLKESYIKMHGGGMSIPLHSFSIVRSEGTYSLYASEKMPYRAYFYSYELDPGYRCSVCANHNRFPKTVSVWQEASLYQSLAKWL